MSMQELPEGITFNNVEADPVEIELEYEVINNTKCNACGVTFESVLFDNFGRYKGIIKVLPKNSVVWENSLPKDKTRSIKILDDNLVMKLDKHKERHKND